MNSGDLVVCIYTGPIPEVESARATLLEKGRVYTCASAHECKCGCGNHCIEVCELPNLDFFSRRFRPVRPTSIECFRELLETAPKELEPAP